MASATLFPPIVDSYMPAFIAGNNSYCRIYFSLSKFNSYTDITSVQATIVKQENGMSVVNNLTDSYGHYRKTNIILNLTPTQVIGPDNLYYIDIYNYDLKSISGNYSGWIPGWIYKIQIRLSEVNYLDNGTSQSVWLNNNASHFSEWSTQCVVKSIGNITIDIPGFTDATSSIILDELDFRGIYKCEDVSELLYSYKLKLYEVNNNHNILLEESDEIFAGPQYSQEQQFNYVFKYECESFVDYSLIFEYQTKNKYINSFNFNFRLRNVSPSLNVDIITLENDVNNLLTDITSYGDENENGRICLKLYSNSHAPYTGKVCIRRSDSRTNFKQWSDIRIIDFNGIDINDYIAFYDYMIESGVFYKYGILAIDSQGSRDRIKITDNLVLRDFDYSLLLGEDNKQLKLMYDNTMQNYKINVSEGKTDTLGGQFSYTSRNGNTYYKSFPINGIITFNMDETEQFITRAKIYGNQTLADLYEQYRLNHNISRHYDVIFEREFRKEVLKFLLDGKMKLFKSPTEGNIIVRLMDINCTPQQTTNRLVYSFTSNAYETDEATMENYQKYKFYKVEV